MPSILQDGLFKVLVVDDDMDTAESTALLLKLSGHDVEVAFDGHRAIEIARTQQPDFVLLDLRMPRLDGYEVASRLRHEVAGPVVIIAVTGCGLEQERHRALKAGCDHHFVKPIDPEALVELLSAPITAATHPTQPAPSPPDESACEGDLSPPSSRRAEIINALGLHLRAADKFTRLAQKFRAEIRVGFNGRKVNGRSILDLTTLAAECGSMIDLEADGPDAEGALDSLAGLMGRGFDEQ